MSDNERLAAIRVDYPNADTSDNPDAERIRDDVLLLLRLLDEARAEIARLRAPAGGDLVERARQALRWGARPYGTPLDEVAAALATIQREARDAGIEECAAYHAAQPGNPAMRAKEADAIRALTDRIAAEGKDGDHAD